MNIRYQQIEKGVLVASLLFLIPSSPTGQTRNNWNILTEVQGNVASMSISIFGTNTYFDIQKEIILEIDREGNPMGGEIKFVNGQKRKLQQQETVFYWDEFDGAHALWDYLLSKERIVSIDPRTAEIPAPAFGRQCRLITGNGKEFIGKINVIASNPSWLTIEIMGWSLYVYKQNIRAIQQMK
jgi:hypothetical protein